MEDQLKNPFRPVKNVRTIYDRYYQKNVKQVEVQFKDDDPAWIPYDTPIAMMESEIEQWT